MTSFDWEPGDKTFEGIRNRGKWGEHRREESWRDKAARVVAALGALVIWSQSPLKIGEIIPQGRLGTQACAEKVADQPFVVVGEATMEQWNRQELFIGGSRPTRRGDYFYYFVQTD